MKKTLLVGNFGAKNIGDELILSAALASYPNPIVMTANPAWSKQFCENDFEAVFFPPTAFRSFWKFLVDKTYRKQLFELENKVDRVIFAGGGLFAIKMRACFLWFFVFVWLKLLLQKNVSFVFECQGIDQNMNFVSRSLIKYVFSRANSISVRDKLSGEALNDMGITDYELKIDRVLEFFTIDILTLKKKNIIIFNALSKLNNKIWSKIFDDSKDFKMVYLVCQPSDKHFIPESFPGQVFEPKTKTELIAFMKLSKFMVAERLHALILGRNFCGAGNTFTLKSPYSEKVKSFCEKEGISVIST